MVDDFGVDGIPVLEEMAKRNTFFALDIGTRSEDLLSRQAGLEKAIAQIQDVKLAQKVRDFLYFSAGIWPDVDSIHNRNEEMKKLRAQIKAANDSDNQDILHRKVIAIGEGGIDHHWNPSGVDGRCESDFDQATYDGEKQLFMLQLELAKEMNLPFIVHSRDGFEDSLNCIKEVGYNNGIIHCYSYGLEEAKQFLDLGWYIAVGGGVTYTKKSKLEDMKALLNYIPEDRLLLETDAPYLSPVPLRGTPNSPVNIEHTYKFVAENRNTSPEAISELVDNNIKKLFF